jgi:hypothetical protein
MMISKGVPCVGFRQELCYYHTIEHSIPSSASHEVGGAGTQVSQAAAAIQAGWKLGGLKRQRIELALPLIGPTDLDDVSGWGTVVLQAQGNRTELIVAQAYEGRWCKHA